MAWATITSRAGEPFRVHGIFAEGVQLTLNDQQQSMQFDGAGRIELSIKRGDSTYFALPGQTPRVAPLEAAPARRHWDGINLS